MMSKIPYYKPATTYARQVEMLRDRGMHIADASEAKFYLQHINYYRLRAYCLPFEDDPASHTFAPGTDFDTVIELYNFDRQLRLIILDAFERVEVLARSQWAYQMGHKHGPHSDLNLRLARKNHWYKNKEVESSDEIFIDHMRRKDKEELPLVWVACEVMSLGLLSNWYRILRAMHTRRTIASVYELAEAVFTLQPRKIPQRQTLKISNCY